ncbi:MAG: STT3 domain-containing protein, partial [Methanomassiliicoccales archaeon]
MEGKEASSLAIRNPFKSFGGIRTNFSDSWLGKNWHTILVLFMVFLLAFFMRSYFGYSLSVDNGFLVSGGSDSYYHKRVIDHVTSTGQHLVLDPLLNYPIGMRNPRPPLYDWSIAVSGMLISSLSSVSLADAVGYSLILSTAFWGALTVFPVYMIGRTAFGNKAGIIAAFLFAIMPGHISRSVLSFADHDSMVLFFSVCSFYFLLVSLKVIQGDKWVESWKDGKSILNGLANYLRINWSSICYAVLAGLCLAAVGMIWTGYAYLLVIVLAYYLAQIFINRFRNADSLGVMITLTAMLLVAFAVMAPVYYQMNYWGTWFDIPFYLFLGSTIVAMVFVVTRDYPWALVIPSFAILAGFALIVLSMTAPDIFEAIISGQGYFVKSKLYSTISEAQAPSFSDLALSFGAITFWLSFAGVVIAAIKIRKNVAPYFVFIVVWTAVSMFMAVSAARFMFNASPAFALTAGWIVAMIVDAAKFSEISRALASGPGIRPLSLLRRAIKIRHVFAAFFLAFLVVLPNVWGATDAAIPSELKAQYDKQIYDIMPGFAKPSSYDVINGSNWYFGAFSYSMPLPSQYWPAAWSWFRTADSDIIPISQRPAFLSWWDYGFEAIQEGQHPTVADNFQNAYQFAGNVLMSQNETSAIALFIIRILEKTGIDDGAINQILSGRGVNCVKLYDILNHPERYVEIVKNNPEIYGPRDSDLSATNAKYVAGSVELSKVGLENLVEIYSELRELTGIDVSYVAVDSRLFPFTALSANIFYAPAKLADFRIDPLTNSPVDFFEIKAVDSEGGLHDVANVTSDMTIVNYQIVYKEMFYNSMLYRVFMGYGPYDVGLTQQGLPGLTGSLASYPPMQGWNMTHFRMVYRTAYYNPFPENQARNHSSAWRAVSYNEALELKKKIESGEIEGVVDASASALIQGVVFLQYYDGAVVEGTVTTNAGLPYPDVWVTVLDEYGIPHQAVKTDENGRYEVIAPFGNVTLVYSYGSLDLRTQVATELERVSFDVTYDQAMRKKVDSDLDGRWDYFITKNVMIKGSAIKGKVYWDVNGDGSFTSGSDKLMSDATVIIENSSRGLRFETTASSSGYAFYGLPPMNASLYAVHLNHSFAFKQANLMPLGNITIDIGVKPAKIGGRVSLFDNTSAANFDFIIVDTVNGERIEVTTGVDGDYVVDLLLSGRYIIESSNPSLILVPREINISEGEEKVLNLFVDNAIAISGRVTIGDVAVSNATVAFISENERFWVVTDAKGFYDIVLPSRSYTVFSLSLFNDQMYVHLSYLGASSSGTNYNIRLVRAIITDITVLDHSSRSIAGAEIVVKSQATGAELMSVTNASGSAKLIIPSGGYLIYVRSNDSAYWNDLYVDRSERISIVLSPAISVSGRVWYDENGNGIAETGEYLKNVDVSLRDRSGRAIRSSTDSLGAFGFVVPSGFSYDLTVSKFGFATETIGLPSQVDSYYSNIKLSPLNRTVSGIVRYASMPVSDVTVTFVSTLWGTHAAVSDANGHFHIMLPPGEYYVSVHQNVTIGSNATIYQYTSSIKVLIGSDPDLLEIDLLKRTRVYGSIYPSDLGTATITFSGVENKTVSTSSSFDLYLMEGNYSVYAVINRATADYAFLGLLTITPSSSPLNLTMSVARTIRGMIYSGSLPFSYVVPVEVRNEEGAVARVSSLATGAFEIILPNGNYIASVDYRTTSWIGRDFRYVRYIGNASMTIPYTTYAIISLERSYDNSTMSGIVLDRLGKLTAAAVEFIPMSATAMRTSVTSFSGSFIVSIAPGNYTVYARQIGGQDVFLGLAEIHPYSSTVQNITLLKGMKFSGTTFKGGVAGNATMEIVSSAGAKLMWSSDNLGNFEIILPGGHYSIYLSSTGVEKGMSVHYRGEVSIELLADTSRTLVMQKVEARQVEIQWDESEKMTLSAGQTAIYNLRIINKGNVEDTFVLSASASNWAISFSQSAVTVDFGYMNSQLVTVSITPSEGVGVSHAPITVKVASTVNASVYDSVLIDANILPRYSIAIKFDKPYQVNGTLYSYSFRVDNNGNANDTVVVKIENREFLERMGWNAELKAQDGTHVSNFTVELQAGKVKYFDVLLIPIRSKPSPSITIILSATSENSLSASAILEMKPPMPLVLLPSGRIT